MADEVPSDVRAVLTQLLEAGEQALSADDVDTARRTVETAQTVSRNKLPAGELRAQLLHGCVRALVVLEPADSSEHGVAAEYLRAMARRLAQAD